MKSMFIRPTKIFVSIISIFLLTSFASANYVPDNPVGFVGGSLYNGNTEWNDAGLSAPFGGWCTNNCQYLSAADAVLVLGEGDINVVNVAVAGATTFDREVCFGPTCGPEIFIGYQTQFDRFLRRVTSPFPGSPGPQASHVFIGMSNDCLHSDAFGILQSLTSECTSAEINASITTMIGIGQQALAVGITPVFNYMIKYEDLDIPNFTRDPLVGGFGLDWAISETDYNYFRDQTILRVSMELGCDAIIADGWANFVDLGDGLHPNSESTLDFGAINLAAMEDFEDNGGC